MRKSAEKRAIPPVDVAQRYTIAEAVLYLRISHASIYKEINARRLRVLKHGKLQHLTHLVEKLGLNASRREIRVPESSTPPQFLRLKEVMARVGLRVTTIYRYVANGGSRAQGNSGVLPFGSPRR